MDCPTDKARCVDDMNQSSIPATPDGPADQHHFHCSNGYTIKWYLPWRPRIATCQVLKSTGVEPERGVKVSGDKFMK
ncbi:uncharacterized protein PGTG_16282 [Puccinia graminis f. sp. tritici CRL 75-36-700-3]|uniref:Uncharacterized protein n=1 Tax=Puccinia graminis f. sp. tritici (strain CRL 75-36-700-3 / race SCCL) TaxID=418459 RepID=E3L0A7_PUCGT|nr:uncharacterized protein PGTG_16282 [Puccinia graminis f. sp. tritici CRL 75-36-700-3]EFP89994.1 hypothetical protein PGTG_16282 [Puccinia graminis f. sp. tritici CRL 75-36-700-3]